jgi:hypothetical protein
MKKLNYIFITAFALNFAHAQISEPAWNATITVLDETSQPVAGANVEMSFYVKTKPGEGESGGSVQGLTDTNGVVRLSHPNTGSIGVAFQATKTGYYATTKGHEFVEFQDGDPEKWNPTMTLLLKKIGDPIAMYAKKEQAKMTKENEPVGFDLMAGNWVAPYGTGKTADIFFTVHRKITSPQEFDADLKLTFPNVGDGIAIVPPIPDTGSPLIMPHLAVETGYQSVLAWSYHNFTETSVPASGYFIRVRTVLDSNGNVQSALYGKIQGDVKFYVGTKAPRAGIGFQYYLNPTPNSRNVEFDRKQNLLGGLQSFEQVATP